MITVRVGPETRRSRRALRRAPERPIGTVTAVGAGIPVDDVDPVNFVVVPKKPRPNIDIEKTVNGCDADTAPGPTFRLGDLLTFEYVVTNAGNSVVNDIVVVDDTLGTRTCPTTTLPERVDVM